MSEHATAQASQAATTTTGPAQQQLPQRTCACGQHTHGRNECDSCRQQRPGLLQRTAVREESADGVPTSVYTTLQAPGEPLRPATRALMESRFGHDFSQVRVHADAQAAASAQAVNALAYTVGREVVFGAGQFAPETSAGQQLLAHELAHTIQQGQRAAPGEGLAVASSTDTHERAAGTAGQAFARDNARIMLPPASGAPAALLFRQTPPAPPGGGGTAVSPRRIVYLDANIIEEQLNRGNQPVTTALRRMIASGVDVRIARWTYNELVTRRDIPRLGVANRLLIEDLGLRVEPAPPTLAQRVDVGVQNQPRQVVSVRDAQLVAAARAGGGEIWSFDGAFRNNAQGVQARFGVRVAPESTLPEAPAGSVKDYRVPRRLLGLPPVQVSLTGVVTRGGPAGGGGGGVPPQTPPGGGGQPPPQNRPTQAAGRRGQTTATVGTPDMDLPQVGGPSARGVGTIAGIQLAFQGVNFVLNWLNNRVQEQRVQAALARIQPGVARDLAAHPSLGVLLIFYYSQVQAPAESLIRPGAVFNHLETAYGRTRDEAEEQWRTTPAIRQGYSRNVAELTQTIWIPPARPAGVAAIRTPFPKVAAGAFVSGRTRLQQVEWGGSTGFDDEQQITLAVPSGTQPQFIIMRVPGQLRWWNGSAMYTSTIPVEEWAAAEGGPIPVVNLDPTIPGFNVAAACVFPLDDATDALFATTPATLDNLGQIRYLNFGRARWIRPENIRVTRRLS